MMQQWQGGSWCQGQQGFNRLNERKWQSFKVRSIFNEFAQKLIFHCNLLFICGWQHVPGRVRVSSHNALSSAHPLLQTTPQSPGKMVFQLRQILSCLGLRGEKAVCAKNLAPFFCLSAHTDGKSLWNAECKIIVFNYLQLEGFYYKQILKLVCGIKVSKLNIFVQPILSM